MLSIQQKHKLSNAFWACLLVGGLAATSVGWGALPQNLNYQGRMADLSGPVPDSTGNTVVFRIFNALSGPTELWAEEYSGVTTTARFVSTKSGLFNVILGQYNPINLPFDVPYYLQIEWFKVGVGYETLTPRQPLTMAPYAFRAKFAENAVVSVPLTLTAAGALIPFSSYQLGTANAIYAEAAGATAISAFSNSAAPSIYGVSNNGDGVIGQSNGVGNGLVGKISGGAIPVVSGAGVYGATSIGNGYGLVGDAAGINGIGVSATATGPSGMGVYAQGRTGVLAIGTTFGIVAGGPVGISASSNNVPLYAKNTSGGSFLPAILGEASGTGLGVVGRNPSTKGAGGLGGTVWPDGTFMNGVGVHGVAFSSNTPGVFGEGDYGVLGRVTRGAGNVGVYAQSTTNTGYALRTSGSSIFDGPGNTTTFNTYVSFTAGTNLGGGGGSYVLKAGDSMTGSLYLASDPSMPAEAANKNYVDSNFILQAGDSMTGSLYLASDPSMPAEAANKNYVDTLSNDRVWKGGDTMSGLLDISATAQALRLSGSANTTGVLSVRNYGSGSPSYTTLSINHGNAADRVGLIGASNQFFTNPSGAIGIYGFSTGGIGTQGLASLASGYGISARNSSVGANAIALSATSDSATGTAGWFSSATGVVAVTDLNTGVGLRALNNSFAGGGVAIDAVAIGMSGVGVHARALQGAGSSMGVIAEGGFVGVSAVGGIGGGIGVYAQGNTALEAVGGLTVRGMAGYGASSVGQGRVFFDSTANKFRVSENAGGYVDLIGGGVAAPLSLTLASSATSPLSVSNATGTAGLFNGDRGIVADGFAVAVSASSAAGNAVFAQNSGSFAPTAYFIQGTNTAAAGSAIAVYGQARNSTASIGVFGYTASTAPSFPAAGASVYGYSDAANTAAIWGRSTNGPSNSYAVIAEGSAFGLSATASGSSGPVIAVHGASHGTSNQRFGVMGRVNMPTGGFQTIAGGVGVMAENGDGTGYGMYVRNFGAGGKALVAGANAQAISATTISGSTSAIFAFSSSTAATIEAYNENANEGMGGYFKGVTGVVVVGGALGVSVSSKDMAMYVRGNDVGHAIYVINDNPNTNAVGLRAQGAAGGIRASPSALGTTGSAGVYGDAVSFFGAYGVVGSAGVATATGVLAQNTSTIGVGSSGAALHVSGSIKTSNALINEGINMTTTWNVNNSVSLATGPAGQARFGVGFSGTNITTINVFTPMCQPGSVVLITWTGMTPTNYYNVRANPGSFAITFVTNQAFPANTGFNYLIIN